MSVVTRGRRREKGEEEEQQDEEDEEEEEEEHKAMCKVNYTKSFSPCPPSPQKPSVRGRGRPRGRSVGSLPVRTPNLPSKDDDMDEESEDLSEDHAPRDPFVRPNFPPPPPDVPAFVGLPFLDYSNVEKDPLEEDFDSLMEEEEDRWQDSVGETEEEEKNRLQLQEEEEQVPVLNGQMHKAVKIPEKPNRRPVGRPRGRARGRGRPSNLGNRKPREDQDCSRPVLRTRARSRLCSDQESSRSSDQDQSSDEPLVHIKQNKKKQNSVINGLDFTKEPRVYLTQLSFNGILAGKNLNSLSPIKLPLKPTPDLNSSPQTQKEIKERLKQFSHITQNSFLCERKVFKDSRGMECDCTWTKEEQSKGIKGCGDDCLNRLLMIECSKYCSLGKNCGNKKFQNVDNSPVEVFKTDCKGFGIRAMAEIPPDTFIMEYVGEVLDPKQFKKRAKQFAKDDVKHFYFMALSSEYCIDASRKGNISRFINHSCDPNAETQKWTVNGELRVGFFSTKRISKGDEITFDYKYERYGQQAQKCLCGSSKCRGWLGGEPDKDEEEDEDDDDDEEDDYWSSSGEEEEEEEVEEVKIIVKEKKDVVVEEEESLKPIARVENIVEKKAVEVDEDYQQEKELVVNEKVEEKKVRKKRKRKSPRKIKNYENDGVEEELDRLVTSGIRTHMQTMHVVRLMLQTTDFTTKATLINLMKGADVPCRRLFLDYHGLRVSYNKCLSELGWTKKELELKIDVLDLLSILPIANKTILTESKVWQTISRWARAGSKEELDKLIEKDEEESRATSPINSSVLSSTTNSPPPGAATPSTSTQGTPTTAKESVLSPNIINSIDATVMKEILNQFRTLTPPPPPPPEPSEPPSKKFRPSELFPPGEEPEEEPLPPGEEEVHIQFKEPEAHVEHSNMVQNEKEPIKDVQQPKIRPESEEDITSAVREIMKDMVDRVCQQQTDSNEDTVEKMDDKMDVDVEPISKPDKLVEGDPETKKLVKVVQDKASDLISSWNELPEAFKIPKKEKVKQLRAAHEREADRAIARPLVSEIVKSDTPLKQKIFKPSVPSSYQSNTPRLIPSIADSPPNKPREKRLSRFDDESGVFHQKHLMRDVRRSLFSRKAQIEQEEKEQRELRWRNHIDKCYFLNLDPKTTPFFEQYPEFFWNFEMNCWSSMPPEPNNVPFRSNLPLPKMAKLENLEAFQPSDEILDPRLCYPPGVVEGSLMYDPPEVIQEKHRLEFLERQREVLGESLPPLPPEVPPRPQEPPPRQMPEPIGFLSTDRNEQVPFLDQHSENVPIHTRLEYEEATEPPLPSQSVQEFKATSNIVYQSVPSRSASNGHSQRIVVRLPPKWRAKKDANGSIYYYNRWTKETSWTPPEIKPEEEKSLVDLPEREEDFMDMETASVASSSPKDNDEDGDTDDEDEIDEEDNQVEEEKMEILASDLSAQEKSLLLAKKKTREERHHERRQKRERDREKREYERKKRKERHGKHRKSGLVREHFIPKLTEKDKVAVMTFNEMRERMANRDQIREKQQQEERAEAERDLQIERARRQAEREAMQQSANPIVRTSSDTTTTAAADTSSEVAKKAKDRFLSETSKVIVKHLSPFLKNGQIKNKEDFRHLAKKLTNYIMMKEMKQCHRIEDLKCTDSVKKKAADYIKKYMVKWIDGYKRSPP